VKQRWNLTTAGVVTYVSQVGTIAGISDDVENLRINRNDFMNALDEVQPAFGVSEEELQQVIQNGIIHFAPHVDVCMFPLISHMIWWLSIGTAENRTTVRWASSSVYKDTARQHSPTWTSWFWEDRIGGHYRFGLWVSFHQALISGYHGRILRTTESRRHQQSLRG
jgi:hypothetical protein